jgi:hypothetical protein
LVFNSNYLTRCLEQAGSAADVSIPPLHNAADPFEAGLPRPADQWAAVGLLQWARVPSRMQPWPHLRHTPEPGTRLHRMQTAVRTCGIRR